MKKLLPFSFLLALGAGRLAAQTAAPKAAIVPVVDLQSGYLLGASQSGKWIKPKVAAQAMKSGANMRVFSLTQMLGGGRASVPKTQGAPCPDTLYSEIKPNFSSLKGEVALGGSHHPLRRAVRRESTSQPLYRQVVAGILKKHGIAKPVVQITQIWRVDLEGDGVDEVLLTATRKADGGNAGGIDSASRAGDYSLVLLRRIANGKVENQLVEAEFYPRAKNFNAPGFYLLGTVFDADGDRKMEVLTRGRYYEGDWTTLYALQGTKLKKVLSEGCGA